MKRTHIIQNLKTGLFYREAHPEQHVADADELHADVYAPDDATKIVAQAQPAGVAVREATARQYMSWLGRQSGKKMTNAKRAANSKRAKGKRGSTYRKEHV